MLKHAYIVLAHNEPAVLKTLLRMVDDVRNDVFLHIDRKVDLEQFGELKLNHSQLFMLPRMRINWGGPSQMRVELMAFREAHRRGEYSRYHLVSGVDLPLKTQDYIHDFCDIRFPDREFVGFSAADMNAPEWRSQWEYRFFFADRARERNVVVRKFFSALREMLFAGQRLLGLRRHFDGELKKGTNWVSVTGKFVDWLVMHSKEIERQFRFVFCSDEKFLQTAIWNSPFRDKIFDSRDEMRGAMREIDWQRGFPYVWRIVDLSQLISSEYLFARKFSSEVDESIVVEIENRFGSVVNFGGEEC